MSSVPKHFALSSTWLAAESCPNESQLTALVQQSRKGCHDSYRELVNLYRDRIFRFCLAWTGNHEDAEEMCQDTFVRAYSALPRFRGENQFHAWLLRIARNRCHDHQRSRNQRNRKKNDPLPPEDDATWITDEPSPADCISKTEDLIAMQQAIDSLPHRLKEVMILCCFEGLSHERCAILLGCSRRAVEGRLYRARQQLAQEYGELFS